MTTDDLLDTLLRALAAETPDADAHVNPTTTAAKWHLLRTLMNVRPPWPIQEDLLAIQDQLLTERRKSQRITRAEALPTVSALFPNTWIEGAGRLSLWKGDITTLAVDAIVNAANRKLLGCFIPNHRCIDNAIHSAAGIQLRLECARLMQAQGHDEPTGHAKLTGGYYLPSRFVMHTVGPIVGDRLTSDHRDQLEACYTSCLSLAAQYPDIRSIAFCCISTGEFRFPKDEAARIAVQTVTEWLAASEGRFDRVVFNVFTQEDHDHYARLFHPA